MAVFFEANVAFAGGVFRSISGGLRENLCCEVKSGREFPMFLCAREAFRGDGKMVPAATDGTDWRAGIVGRAGLWHGDEGLGIPSGQRELDFCFCFEASCFAQVGPTWATRSATRCSILQQ